MPIVAYQGQRIPCEPGANLRELLMARGVAPYNGIARWINCQGHGSCGTCAVAVCGHVSPMTLTERLRLALPPHRPANDLRLACQCQVLGDVDVVKHEGFWGQQVNEPASKPVKLYPWRVSRG